MAKVQQQINLTRATKGDIDFIVNSERSPDNAAFIGQWTHEQHTQHLNDEDYIYLIIVTEEQRNRIGYVILSGATDPNLVLNIKRIVVNEKGVGIGRATIKKIKELAFDTLHTHRLWLDVKTFNHRAKYIYETEGFRVEGTLRDCIKNGEHYESLIVLSILKPEYIGCQA